MKLCMLPSTSAAASSGSLSPPPIHPPTHCFQTLQSSYSSSGIRLDTSTWAPSVPPIFIGYRQAKNFDIGVRWRGGVAVGVGTRKGMGACHCWHAHTLTPPHPTAPQTADRFLRWRRIEAG